MDIFQLGIIAAALQLAGYAAYGLKVLRRDIFPNATSWLMFAYGTSLLAMLEWDRDASIALLLLPIACAIASILIAVICLRRTRRAWWPEHLLDRIAFAIDIALTVAYISAWILLAYSLISPQSREFAVLVILICSNIGIFSSFFPLLRQVYLHPQSEHALPWIIWTCAYPALAVATYLEVGGLNELILYPLINSFVHGIIAVHTAYWRHHRGLIV